jgi:hypothetical protein
MKKKLLVTTLCVGLTCCANLNFDGGEYDRFIVMKMTSDRAARNCGTPEVSQGIKVLSDLAVHQYVYSHYRSRRDQVSKVSTEVSSMIEELSAKYEQSSKPSTEYCKVKLADISSGLHVILKTLGGM